MIAWHVTASEADVILRALRTSQLPLADRLADELAELARRDRGVAALGPEGS